MAGFEDRNKMYEEDPTDRETREIFDYIDKRKQTFGQSSQEEELDTEDLEYDVELTFWEEDVNEYLHEIGIEYYYSIDGVPKDRLQRLFDNYYSQAEGINKDRQFDLDPLPNYCAGKESAEIELYKLGYALGNVGVLGQYYKILTDINFARGYWLGKFEKAVKEDNDELILDVSRDIKIYDPETAESELTEIVNKCFTEESSVEQDEEPRLL